MRVYRLLLWLYPASFRREHGAAMASIAAAELAEADGWLERVAVGTRLSADLVANAIGAHFDLLRQDLKLALRGIRRAPGFAATVIVVSALGIGATTASYSVLDHLLVRKLPFPEPDKLIYLYQDQAKHGYRDMELSPPNFRDWKAAQRTLSSFGAYYSFSTNLVGDGEPRRLGGAAFTADVLPTLGVEPLLGRVFSEGDDRPEAAPTLILSHRLWQERFGGDPSVLGRVLRVDDEPTTVIGVMPAGFQFPSQEVDLWKPTRFEERQFEDRTNNWLTGIARLAPGVSLEEARADLGLIAARLARAYPEANADNGASLFPLRDELSRTSRLVIHALFAAALAVLLIACTNLASLLLTRSIGRQRELALRAALGAGRERLIRQLTTESLLLALAGGGLGVVLAKIATPLGARLVPHSLPIAGPPQVDGRILVFALALTALTGLAFGVAPALGASRQAASEALRDGARAGSGVRRERFRSGLVLVEVALSLGLVVATGLLGRALLQVLEIDPGFRSEGVLTARTWLPHPRYEDPEVRHAFYSRVLSEVRALPGVTAAGYVSFLPMTMGGGIWSVEVEGRPPEPGSPRSASLRFATPGYLETLGIPLLAGRDLADSDTDGALDVAVVSRSFVEKYWPGENPLGKRFAFGFRTRTVVGIVGDIKVRGLERTSEPQVYLSPRQVPAGGLPFYDPKDLVLRTASAPESLIPAVRRIVREVDPSQPISDLRTMDDLVAQQTAPRAAQERVLAGFALVALLLAGLGIHGLLAHTVAARLPELGVRLALGARPLDLVVDLAQRLGRLALAGIALGTALGLAAGRLLESLLAGVSPSDPATLGIAIGSILVTALAGGLVPAVRASRVDPTRVMREG